MWVATPQSKLVPVLTVDDARDMYSRDATAAFKERRRTKGKKLYGDYAVEETIAISSEDEDDMELAKRLRSDPPSPTMFAGMVKVKPEVLTVEEANERMLLDKEQRVRMMKAATKEPSVCNEVAEGTPLGAGSPKGVGPTSLNRGLDHTSDSRHLGTRVGDGPPKCVSALARRLPSPEHQPAVYVAAIIQLWAYAAAANMPVHACPAGGRPQHLACPRSFQAVDTPATSASHPHASTPPSGRPTHVWVG